MEMILRTHGVSVSGRVADSAIRRVTAAIDRLRRHIRMIRIQLEDQNGRKGGNDKVCVIVADLDDRTSVVVRERHASILAAITRASHRIAPAIHSRMARRTGARRSLAPRLVA